MATGKVKWFNEEKGYGFLIPDDDSEEVFAHYSGIAGMGFRNLKEGQQVEYGIEESEKGPRAVNICVIAEAEGGGENEW